MSTALDYTRPDEVAECWDNVPDDLYDALWAVANTMPPIPNLEDSGPADHVGFNSVSSFWDRFTPEHQALLTKLAEEN